jgi:hypothetical protein
MDCIYLVNNFLNNLWDLCVLCVHQFNILCLIVSNESLEWREDAGNGRRMQANSVAALVPVGIPTCTKGGHRPKTDSIGRGFRVPDVEPVLKTLFNRCL